MIKKKKKNSDVKKTLQVNNKNILKDEPDKIILCESEPIVDGILINKEIIIDENIILNENINDSIEIEKLHDVNMEEEIQEIVIDIKEELKKLSKAEYRNYLRTGKLPD